MKKNTFTFNGNKKGFTLIELLVVVAIIAILVSISMSYVFNAAFRAKAAADGANLRALNAVVNIVYLDGIKTNEEIAASQAATKCRSFSGAFVYVAFSDYGVEGVYYVKGENAYCAEYFAELALNGVSETANSMIKTMAELEETYGVDNILPLTGGSN